MSRWATIATLVGVALVSPAPPQVWAQPAPADVLPALQQRRVSAAVDRALLDLSRQQRSDGAFPTLPRAQPGVTSLCVSAFLARGHVPGAGPWGEAIDRGIEYTLSCQQQSGLLAKVPPEPEYVSNGACRTGMYDHAIAGVMLCEVYGMTAAGRAERLREAIERALAFTIRFQQARKQHPTDVGGWRYLRRLGQVDSDLSITSWQLMFLRSARNAGFDVPSECIDQAMDYVRRRYDPGRGTFAYCQHREQQPYSQAMAGAGILSLALGGMHDHPMARSAGQYVLATGFGRYNLGDRYHYGAYYCSLGMHQLGGDYWRQFYPSLATALVENQSPSGTWGPERNQDGMWGTAYSTALGAHALAAPYQLLPIYQR